MGHTCLILLPITHWPIGLIANPPEREQRIREETDEPGPLPEPAFDVLSFRATVGQFAELP
jgi:hypothetical protein